MLFYYVNKNNCKNLTGINCYKKVSILSLSNNFILENHNNIEHVLISNKNPNTKVILRNLPNLKSIAIENNCKIILGDNLNSFKEFSCLDENSLDKIEDKFNYLNNLEKFFLCTNINNFIYDERYINVTEINLNKTPKFVLKEYPKLKILNGWNINSLKVNASLPSLKRIMFNSCHNPMINFEGSDIPNLEELIFICTFSGSFYSDYELKNLKIFSSDNSNEKYLTDINLKFHKDAPKLKELKGCDHLINSNVFNNVI